MSLKDIINDELATKLKALTADDFEAIARAGSVGMDPKRMFNGIQAITDGEDCDLPNVGGGPRPLTIQVHSFLKDYGQYNKTYGLSSARAGELTDLLKENPDDAIKAVTEIVTTALRKRGSPRPVTVTATGMPGTPAKGVSAPGVGRAGRAALKAEIMLDPTGYGMYAFEAVDTGNIGSQRFRVGLGGGLYATHPSKVGSVDAARICRKHGRKHALIVDRICFWLEGRNPLYGDAIPSKVTFDGRLKPNEAPPANPVLKDKTTVQE